MSTHTNPNAFLNPEDLKTYLIEPLAPLVIRTGRPFNSQASAADDANFPLPSTLAGALRTAHAKATGKKLDINLAQIATLGPLPIKLDPENRPTTLLVPKPTNVIYVRQLNSVRQPNSSETHVVRAQPRALPDTEGMDLPEGLMPVEPETAVSGKPISGPKWWSLAHLDAFHAGKTLTLDAIQKNSWTPAPDDVRTHVALNRSTHAAESGLLFQTSGLSFLSYNTQTNAFGQQTFPENSIGLLGGLLGDIHPGVITLGGERRLSAIQPSPNHLWPVLSNDRRTQITTGKHFCMTLLTPAFFAKGWRPGWLGDDLCGEPPHCPGLKLRLHAAAINRWIPHSGWDLDKQRPRAARKLVAAGSVYWFEIVSMDPEESLSALWLSSLSDDEQDRRDGFGLAILHPWAFKAS